LAKERAERFVIASQQGDGGFRYVINLFSGQVQHGLSLQRQAGTTLSMCENARLLDDVNTAVTHALTLFERFEHRWDTRAVLTMPGAPEAQIGRTALPLAAMLTCRPRVGERLDPLIVRLSHGLLAFQREDGGFFPRVAIDSGDLVAGHEPLYAGGQAILALVLLERALQSGALPADSLETSAVRGAVEGAMNYYGTEYWDHFGADFFYLEENWHCLAARAALPIHRHDAYEQFCIEHTDFKARLVLREDSGVAPDLVGSWGFGNVVLPHNTPTAGFGEALAATMHVKQARGELIADDRALMAVVLEYLLTQQWRPENCFACTRKELVIGAWSEHVGTPVVRIDYVQHALSALGQGAPFVLGTAESATEASDG